MKKTTVTKFLRKFFPYILVITAFFICQSMIAAGTMPRTTKSLLIPVCVYIVMAVSLNLTVGISGELSLGHAGFMSIGAFTGIVIAAYTRQAFGVPETVQLLLAIIAGGIMAGIMGVLIGIPVLRLQGDYLAIVTLAFGEIIRNVLNCIYISLDGKTLHFSFNRPDLPGKLLFRGPTGATGVSRIATFTAGFLLVLFTLFVVINLIHSRSGRAIMAIRDNKIAAEACGLDVTKYRMMAFVTSAALAGMGGALFGLNYSTLVPANFSFNTSILILVYVVLGGIGNITGSIIAATVLYVLPEQLRAFADYRMLVYAVVLIAVMLITNNQSIKNFLDTLRERSREKSEKKGGEAA
ncbi:MAG: branched-chain amino acid ABC transporter permease [Oscillospiraceae bacterium]|nr:branched-chain amino acid ABC transporter permease [Oscillospiraceae bacterium]MDY5642710.1 branched-chain amino acid ABC transporter permease [Candidatus Faecousia sp.]